ncbi:MAG: phiLdb [Herbinix sp.]|jgi:hypothetical protein|nr:phiLdb [Herbinix sp.]
MKVSEITATNVAGYLKLEAGEYSTTDITPILTAAKNFISSYTGIPITSTDTTVITLDNYEDFYIVVMVLCQDMYDNRSLYVDKSNLNKVVDTILGMHCINLL